MVAYFIRRSDDNCAVIKLYPDNREEIVQGDLTLIEAEILCESKIADIPKPSALPFARRDDPADQTIQSSGRPSARQLSLKF
jgi:hypothetical protein